VRLPSDQRTLVGTVSDAGTGRPASARSPGCALVRGAEPIVVSQVRPPLRPSTVRGTTSTDPSEAGSKVKLPNATGPVPGTATRSVTCAAVKTSRSHFAGGEPVVKRLAYDPGGVSPADEAFAAV
jgi:hypothetical protein